MKSDQNFFFFNLIKQRTFFILNELLTRLVRVNLIFFAELVYLICMFVKQFQEIMTILRERGNKKYLKIVRIRKKIQRKSMNRKLKVS